MAFEFKFPDVGEGITEGEIVKWLVKEGDKVKENDNIAKIETDKAIVDVPSPKTGIILKIHFKEGDKIKVGETLVTIGEKGEKISENKKKSTTVVGELEEATEELKQEIPIQQVTDYTNDKVRAMPRVRKIASKLGVDITKLKGSGSDNSITEDDVLNFYKKGDIKPQQNQEPQIKISKKYDLWGYIERVPFKGIRKTIADNLMNSIKNTAQVTSMIDIDVTNLWDFREKVKNKFKDVKLTFLPYIIKATILGLKNYPYLNAELENEEILIKKYYNLGIAVETPAGLMVPIIKGADRKDIIQIAKEIEDLSKKAKDRKIDIMDLKGGTFTITNYGSIGGNYATPIINYQQSAILGIGRIFDKLILNNGKVENRKMLPVSLTFDHQLIDGAEAANFLIEISKILEDPEKIK